MKKVRVCWRDFFYGLMILAVGCGYFHFSIGRAEAGVKGSCANCHTMHNKQGGIEVFESGPQPYLIKTDVTEGENPCLGCHAKRSDVYADSNTPQVIYYNGDAGKEKQRMLAGGTYYFVNEKKQEDTNKRSCQKGHNVIGLEIDGYLDGGEDEILVNTPPGGEALSGQLTCAGSLGCHGDRSEPDPITSIKGGHHSPVTDSYRNGEGVANSYRMLKGVQGRVADQWEYGETDELLSWSSVRGNSNINIYKAIDVSNGGQLQGNDKETGSGGSINDLCGQCHGDADGDSPDGFHSSKGIVRDTANLKSPWLRHPTDVGMNKGEYVDYPGINLEGYSTEVPVGFTDVTSVSSLESMTPVVLCISCHRAHGSEYDDALRWDYKKMQTGAPTRNGCFRCHTEKSGISK